MNATLRSLLAEMSPNWLRARSLKARPAAERPDPLEGMEDAREPGGPTEPSGPRQRPCYRPPRRDGADIASNM